MFTIELLNYDVLSSSVAITPTQIWFLRNSTKSVLFTVPLYLLKIIEKLLPRALN